MARSTLYWRVAARLEADATVDAPTAALVRAALDGDAALAAALRGEPGSDDPAPSDPESAGAPPGAWLARLAVRGFRGIGEAAALELDPGPGLTVVIGRNGSGKSSFAEGLETLLTGESRRWSGRPKAWKDGWRNLHTRDAGIEATFVVEGHPEPVVLSRTWGPQDPLEVAELRARVGLSGLPGRDPLGWREPLVAFRPFLSYNELGGLIDAGPSKLYDSLQGILGLEELAVASNRLRQARLDREREVKQVKADVATLLDRLDKAADPRATRAHALLSQRILDLDALQALATGESAAAEDAEVRLLRRLAGVRGPDPGQTARVVAELRAASERVAALAKTRDERDRTTAALLRSAITWHHRFPEPDCPVCGTPGTLDDAWRARLAAHATELEQTASKTRSAHDSLKMAVEAARNLVRATPGLDPVAATAEARAAHEAWGKIEGLEPAAMADRLATGDVVARAYAEVARVATERLDALQSAWRPFADQLLRLIPRARDAREGYGRIATLKAAEAWMAGAEGDLRDARFAPIAEQAQAVWRELRHSSNVDLVRVSLAGSSTRRHVELDVTVDDTPGVALGVMSQGELHALALSLFLPRLTLLESPFRFLVVDDPVQAMDPHKVDGLARVLAETAQTRQVLVFTHDGRLPEAIRRLGIRARIEEVSRRASSVVEVRTALDPVDQLLSDARHVAENADKIGTIASAGVVPGLCRAAVEVALTRIARRRLLGSGMPHDHVEAELARCHTTTQLAALALANGRLRQEDVIDWLDRELGNRAGEHLDALNAGTHEGHAGALRPLVENTRSMVRALAALG